MVGGGRWIGKRKVEAKGIEEGRDWGGAVKVWERRVGLAVVAQRSARRKRWRRWRRGREGEGGGRAQESKKYEPDRASEQKHGVMEP